MIIDEIALKVGYKTSQGLIALFKKFGDTTPLAYRKSLKDTRWTVGRTDVKKLP